MVSLPSRVRAHAIELVLFTRPRCSLCDDAKDAVNDVRKSKGSELTVINVLDPQHARWKRIYEFDTPVLHVQKRIAVAAGPMNVPKEQKLFHRFSEAQIKDLMARFENKS